jgi:hypothetical protein
MCSYNFLVSKMLTRTGTPKFVGTKDGGSHPVFPHTRFQRLTEGFQARRFCLR